MDWDEYIKWGEEAVKWGSNYRKTLRDHPVRSQNKPGDTYNSLPSKPPEQPENIEKIFDDKIQDVYEPSTAAMTVGGPIKCHGIPKSFGYKTLGYQGKHSISINVGYTIIIIETCVEDSGSPVKTEIAIE